MKSIKWFVILGFMMLHSCGNSDESINSEDALFERIDADVSGVTFKNMVPESDSMNQFNYHYFFNGAGVGMGDINNDGLNDLYFASNSGSSKLYLNKGDFKFEDITESAGVGTNQWMTGVSMVDVNNDGLLDIYVCSSGPSKDPKKKANKLFINLGNLKFKEASQEWGVANEGNTSCATFFDFDRDGDLDLYVGNHAQKYFSDINVPFKKTMELNETSQQFFYRNDGNKFTDITTSAGMMAGGYCLSATAGDFNSDGLIDLYVCNDYHVPDFYYINQGDGTFKDECFTSFKHISNNSMGSDAADVNNDGLLDFMSLDMLPELPERFMTIMGPRDYEYVTISYRNNYGRQYMKNVLQINQGNNKFSDLSYLYGVARTDWSWSPLFCDFNDDGLQDLFITNGYYRDVTNLDFVQYQNRKEQTKGEKVTHKEVLDRLPIEKIQNYFYLNTGKGMLNIAQSGGTPELSLSTGSAYGDLNGDGRPDLVVCNQDEEPFIYKNKNTKNGFQNIQLFSSKKKSPIGSKVYVKGKDDLRVFEYQSTRGYLSSSDPEIHIGLGDKSVKDFEFYLVTSAGKMSKIKPQDNNTWKIDIELSSEEFELNKIFNVQSSLMKYVGNLGNFKHQEQETPDFKREPMLPHRFTMMGPGMASGDVNGDRLDDIFVGNAAGSSGSSLMIQGSNGKFSPSSSQPWKSIQADVTGCLFFDFDGDKDLDLYVAVGGSEFAWPSNKYNHKLYENNGKGNFTDVSNKLPSVIGSSSSVAAADYDNDGDLDLFVAGRVLPAVYPVLEIRSYLLKNQGGKFIDATQTDAPDLYMPGMINEAIFTDYNNDNLPDLMLVGEYTPVVFMKNSGGKFINATKETGTFDYSGWFNSICPIDIDNDGDLDYVVTNKGNNSFIQSRKNEPISIYWADVDKNSRLDFFLSYQTGGKEYPLYQMDEMAMAFPSFLGKKFPSYSSYTGKTMEEIFGAENLSQNKMFANTFSHLLLVNNGGVFTVSDLPWNAQIGPITGILAIDVDANGFDDLVCIGNNSYTRVTHGPDDAQNGMILLNSSNGMTVSGGVGNGFYVPGDGRGLVWYEKANQKLGIAASQNNDFVKLFDPNAEMKFLRAPSNAVNATLILKDGTKKSSYIGRGSGYYSSKTPGIVINKLVKSVIWTDKNGKDISSSNN